MFKLLDLEFIGLKTSKYLLFILVIFVFLVSGCDSTISKNREKKVKTIEGNKFPHFLVGRWKADKHGWEFVFKTDGTITSAVISIGRVELRPNEKMTFSAKREGKGVFQTGPWSVEYQPDSNELKVVIVLEYFNQDMGKDRVEGASTDIFIGQVSEESNLWKATWYSFPEFTAYTYTNEAHELPIDPNDNPKDTLTFIKLTSKNK